MKKKRIFVTEEQLSRIKEKIINEIQKIESIKDLVNEDYESIADEIIKGLDD